MALFSALQKFITKDGQPVDGASVIVKLAGSATPATLYATRDGGTKSNPFLTDAAGNALCYVSPGRYDMTVTFNAEQVTFNDVEVGPVSQVGSFTDGVTLTDPDQWVRDSDGALWEYTGSTANFPLQVAPGSAPDGNFRVVVPNGGRQVSSVASLRNTKARFNGEAVQLVSYYAGANKGGGFFVWDAAATAADDGGVTIAVAGVATGRWVRQLDGFISLYDLGLTSNTADASDLIELAFNLPFDVKHRGAETITISRPLNLIPTDGKNFDLGGCIIDGSSIASDITGDKTYILTVGSDANTSIEVVGRPVSGDDQIELTDGSLVSAGDVLLLSSSLPFFDGWGGTQKRGELVEVEIVSGNIVTLRSPVIFTYTGAFTLNAELPSNPARNVKLKDFTVVGAGAGSHHGGLAVRYGVDCELHDVGTDDCEDRGINLISCLRCWTYRGAINRSTGPQNAGSAYNSGYGVVFNRGTKDSGSIKTKMNKCVTATTGGSGIVSYNNAVIDCISENSLENGFTNHEPNIGWRFIRNKVYHPAGVGFNERGVDTLISGSRIYGAGESGIRVTCFGAAGTYVKEGTMVTHNHVYCEQTGIEVRPGESNPAGSVANVTISTNKIRAGRSAIGVSGSNGIKIFDNDCKYNLSGLTSVHGFSMFGDGDCNDIEHKNNTYRQMSAPASTNGLRASIGSGRLTNFDSSGNKYYGQATAARLICGFDNVSVNDQFFGQGVEGSIFGISGSESTGLKLDGSKFFDCQRTTATITRVKSGSVSNVESHFNAEGSSFAYGFVFSDGCAEFDLSGCKGFDIGAGVNTSLFRKSDNNPFEDIICKGNQTNSARLISVVGTGNDYFIVSLNNLRKTTAADPIVLTGVTNSVVENNLP